jgi:glycosyltransferase involved in cell wall biosynthesis
VPLLDEVSVAAQLASEAANGDLLNILYHFRVRGTGAEGVHIAGIANGFRAWGHNVTFVSPTGVDPTRPAITDGKPSTPEAEEPKAAPRALQRWLHFLADRAPQPFFEAMELGYNSVAIPRLLREGRAIQADLLYERYAFFNLAGAVASRRLGIPFVVEVNELAGYERVRDQTFVRVAKAVERRVLRQASLIVTVSEFLTERCQEIVDGTVPAVTIPNGVSADWLSHAASSRQNDRIRLELGLGNRPTVCFVGGLVHWHNFGLLLQAMQRLRQAVPDAALLIVGEGPCREFIETEAAGLGISDGLVFAGRVAHDQVADYIALSDVAVIPETNEYRSPIKMFEYMAAGKAVVAPHMPPVAAVIDQDRSGLLFQPGSVDELSRALVRAFSDRAFAAALGRAARQQIRRRYTWEEHARRILRLARTRGIPAPAGARIGLARG